MRLKGDGDVDQTTAFYLGYNASVIGIIKSRNPFPQDSESYEWWRRGWECKFHGESIDDHCPKELDDDLTLGVR